MLSCKKYLEYEIITTTKEKQLTLKYNMTSLCLQETLVLALSWKKEGKLCSRLTLMCNLEVDPNIHVERLCKQGPYHL
jgi:hypothetical protein